MLYIERWPRVRGGWDLGGGEYVRQHCRYSCGNWRSWAAGGCIIQTGVLQGPDSKEETIWDENDNEKFIHCLGAAQL